MPEAGSPGRERLAHGCRLGVIGGDLLWTLAYNEAAIPLGAACRRELAGVPLQGYIDGTESFRTRVLIWGAICGVSLWSSGGCW